MRVEQIDNRILELEELRKKKIAENNELDVALKEIEARRQELVGHIALNLWVNLPESKELERLLIVQEELAEIPDSPNVL